METITAVCVKPLMLSMNYSTSLNSYGLSPAIQKFRISSSRAVIGKHSALAVRCQGQANDREDKSPSSRREVVLNSSAALVLASLFQISGERPNFLGPDKRDPPSLALCPRTPNCISTAEEMNDPAHFVPPWTYNPEDGRGLRKPASQSEAMAELVEVVERLRPDGFSPNIVDQKEDYLYVEYESPTFGFTDDVEFWFPTGARSLVEYRSASRLGESDFDINRKRIRSIRQELEKRGWESIGY